MADRSELQLGIVSVAAGIALLVVILGAWALTRQSQKHRVRWESVTAASRDLKAGDLVTADDLTMRAVPVQNVSPNALRDANDAIGQRLLVPVSSGDELHRTFFAAGSAVCKEPKLLAQACTGTKERTPCKITLSGYLVGTFGCQASWEPSGSWLEIGSDTSDLEWSFSLAFPPSRTPDFKKPYREKQLSSVSVAVDSTGPKRGPRFTVQKLSDDTGGGLGSLTVTLDSIDPDVLWPHGTLSATALPACIVEQTCKAEGQPSLQIEVSF